MIDIFIYLKKSNSKVKTITFHQDTGSNILKYGLIKNIHTSSLFPPTKFASHYCSIKNECILPYSFLLPSNAILSRDDFLTSPLYCYNSARQFRIVPFLRENQSSKVEAAVNSMKEKQKMISEASKEGTLLDKEGKAISDPNKKGEGSKPVPVKKPLKTRIWEELVHYYHGFRLLFIDINVSRKLLWRVLNGKTLTRRENKLLVRTTSDLFRLIPFSVFIIVPFMELLLPVFIKLFPGMLPSTFQTAKDREDKLKQQLQVKLEMAKFLQTTLDEMAVQHREHKSEDAKEFAEFFEKVKNPSVHVTNTDIIKFAKRFNDEITLDSLSRAQLSALCRLLEVNTMGTSNILLFNLRLKLRALVADDRVIAREGVESLDLFELQQACKSRGMRAYGLTAEKLRAQLQEWIDLSLNSKVPPTLLLLSRALPIYDDETTTTDKLKETIRVLPESAAAQARAAIGELEGKIDNKTKIEIIKEEERKIQEEREEEREEQKAKKEAELLLDKATVMEAEDISMAMAQIDNIKPESIKAKEMFAESQPVEAEVITSKDVKLLSDALETLSQTKSMQVEKEKIKDLKEEMEDYKEDVEELHEIRTTVKEPIKESRAAKLLYKKVNTMIEGLDKVLADLEKKAAETSMQLEKDKRAEEIIRIDELVGTVKKLKQTSDESRLQKIENVLSKLDTDKDGVINIDEVLNVVEAIGRDDVNLNEKQIEELLTVLEKEQIIEAEDKIEKAIAKSMKDAKKIEESNQELDGFNQEIENVKEVISDEVRDAAKLLEDKATDLNLVDQKKTKIIDEKQTDKVQKRQEDIAPKIATSIPPPTPSPKVNQKDKLV
ncbi:mitochondrial proton/calcium exchanger protein-like [Teleopsis dalmanni]|uniref:mitochondrial proton/calcium exchanger protein-like n=1 Tax=Teleopsis dalmanni TaxID=139649 RepID=UPI0018CEF0F7|nr:mitochondrial proton/calcium exchanger protein-like [Teleopsis dalmanni]